MSEQCGFTKPHIRVLLIEDDAADADYIRELLAEEKSARFELVYADRLSEGIKQLDTGEFDVVLLDLGLRESYGFDTFARFKKKVYEVPIIVLTGLNDEAMATKAMQEGAQDYLVKGDIDGRLLIRSIRYSVERHRLLSVQRAISLNDELTGLYNRRGFTILARQQLKAVERMAKRMMLLFVDLDSMKSINDTLGHKEGDRALMDAATVLRSTFRREADIIGRVGGDEFAVVAVEHSSTDGKPCIELLQRNVEAFNAGNKRPYRLSLSVGVAQYSPESPLSLDELLYRADTEMYAEKSSKKGISVVKT
jgi:two-component system cell cycle response regulator